MDVQKFRSMITQQKVERSRGRDIDIDYGGNIIENQTTKHLKVLDKIIEKLNKETCIDRQVCLLTDVLFRSFGNTAADFNWLTNRPHHKVIIPENFDLLKHVKHSRKHREDHIDVTYENIFRYGLGHSRSRLRFQLDRTSLAKDVNDLKSFEDSNSTGIISFAATVVLARNIIKEKQRIQFSLQREISDLARNRLSLTSSNVSSGLDKDDDKTSDDGSAPNQNATDKDNETEEEDSVVGSVNGSVKSESEEINNKISTTLEVESKDGASSDAHVEKQQQEEDETSPSPKTNQVQNDKSVAVAVAETDADADAEAKADDDVAARVAGDATDKDNETTTMVEVESKDGVSSDVHVEKQQQEEDDISPSPKTNQVQNDKSVAVAETETETETEADDTKHEIKYWQSNDTLEQLVNSHPLRIIINKDEFGTLKNETWVKGDHIDACVFILNRLKPRVAMTKVLPTTFLQQLTQDQDKNLPVTTLSKYMENNKITTEEKLICPYGSNFHWSVIHVKPHEKKIIIYDSLLPTKHNLSQRIEVKAAVDFFHQYFYDNDEDWNVSSAQHYPQQKDGHNCGIFSIHVIIKLYLYDKYEFDLQSVDLLRRDLDLAYSKKNAKARTEALLSLMASIEELNVGDTSGGDTSVEISHAASSKKKLPVETQSKVAKKSRKTSVEISHAAASKRKLPAETQSKVAKKSRPFEKEIKNQFGFSQIPEQQNSQGTIPSLMEQDYQTVTLDVGTYDHYKIHQICGPSYYETDNKNTVSFYFGHDQGYSESEYVKSVVRNLYKWRKDGGVQFEMKYKVFRNGIVVKDAVFLSYTTLNMLSPFLYKDNDCYENFNIFCNIQAKRFHDLELFQSGNQERQMVLKHTHFLSEYSPIQRALKKNGVKGMRKQTYNSFGVFHTALEMEQKIDEDITEKFSDDVLTKKDVILKFISPVAAVIKRHSTGAKAGRTKTGVSRDKGKEFQLQQQRADATKFFHSYARNLMVTALENIPIPLEAAAISLYGSEECVKLLNDSINKLYGYIRASGVRMKLRKQEECIFPLHSFKTKLSETALRLLEMARRLPWAEIYSTKNGTNLTTLERLKTVDANFFAYIHLVLLGDAFSEEKEKNLKGPVTRLNVSLNPEELPEILTQSYFDDLKEKGNDDEKKTGKKRGIRNHDDGGNIVRVTMKSLKETKKSLKETKKRKKRDMDENENR